MSNTITRPSPVDDLSRRKFWQRHVERWQHSELSQRAYCREHELVYHQFVYWKRQLLGRGDCAGEFLSGHDNAFVAVSVGSLPDNATLSVVMPNGVRIDGISENTLSLAAALAAQL